MSKDIKILDGQIEFFGGDFRTSETTNQEVEFILRSNKGVWRQNPTVGVGLLQELNGESTSELIKKRIRLQMKNDNKRVLDLEIANGEIDINAVNNE